MGAPGGPGSRGKREAKNTKHPQTTGNEGRRPSSTTGTYEIVNDRRQRKKVKDAHDPTPDIRAPVLFLNLIKETVAVPQYP